jgi:ABC-type phosphate transport system, periplasmic component
MKSYLITALALCTAIICTSCGKDEPIKIKIEGITFDNYPKVDGSTSTQALNTMIACKLLGIEYVWMPLVAEYSVQPIPFTQQLSDFFGERILSSQTHGAFMNLIDGKVDIILTHRTISPDEKEYADTREVKLIETSIALDAFVFVVNKDNPIKSLKVDEIQKIYTKDITNWSEVGGNNMNIKVFTRPRNSGSEEVFRELVMGGMEPGAFPEAAIGAMAWVFNEVKSNTSSICYTFNNYKDVIARTPDSIVPKIAVNGIFPNDETVKNRTYPFISEVHVAIRSDLKHNSMAYKLYEWLQSENAKPVIKECGFLPK